MPDVSLEIIDFQKIDTLPASLLFSKRAVPVFAFGVSVTREAIAFARLAQHGEVLEVRMILHGRQENGRRARIKSNVDLTLHRVLNQITVLLHILQDALLVALTLRLQGQEQDRLEAFQTRIIGAVVDCLHALVIGFDRKQLMNGNLFDASLIQLFDRVVTDVVVLVTAYRDPTAALSENLYPLVSKTKAIGRQVRHDTRVVLVVTTVVHDLDQVRVRPNIADAESDLGQRARQLVENLLERLEGHVVADRRVGLVAEAANDGSFFTRTRDAVANFRDFEVENLQHAPLGVIFLLGAPTVEFTRLGVETVVVICRDNLLNTSVFVVDNEHLCHWLFPC